MKQSFVFYRSFMDAVNTIPQIKYKYLLLENIIKLGLFSEKSEEKLMSFCAEIEQKLSKNSHVLGLFLAIKPQIIANYKKYLNGCKGSDYGYLGAEYGILGGRPKNPPNENVNEKEKENENVNEKENENVPSSKKEKYDPFFNPTKTFFAQEYEKVFGSHPYLSYDDAMRLMELKREYKNINEIIPQAIEKLKRINFKELNFTPSASWLLKGNNFERVMNGEFEPKKTEMELLKEELGID